MTPTRDPRISLRHHVKVRSPTTSFVVKQWNKNGKTLLLGTPPYRVTIITRLSPTTINIYVMTKYSMIVTVPVTSTILNSYCFFTTVYFITWLNIDENHLPKICYCNKTMLWPRTSLWVYYCTLQHPVICNIAFGNGSEYVTILGSSIGWVRWEESHVDSVNAVSVCCDTYKLVKESWWARYAWYSVLMLS